MENVINSGFYVKMKFRDVITANRVKRGTFYGHPVYDAPLYHTKNKAAFRKKLPLINFSILKNNTKKRKLRKGY